MTSAYPDARAYRKHRLLFWSGGIFAMLILALFVTKDPSTRRRGYTDRSGS